MVRQAVDHPTFSIENHSHTNSYVQISTATARVVTREHVIDYMANYASLLSTIKAKDRDQDQGQGQGLAASQGQGQGLTSLHAFRTRTIANIDRIRITMDCDCVRYYPVLWH